MSIATDIVALNIAVAQAQAAVTANPAGTAAIDAAIIAATKGILGSISPVANPASPGKPCATNTGPTNPAIMVVHQGSLTVTTPNAIIKDIDVRGSVCIKAPGVVISNFRIDGTNGGGYGIQVINASGGNNSVVASDGEITNCAASGIFGNNWTAQRLNIHEMGSDATDGGGSNLLEGCWIHAIGKSPGAHADGFQANNGRGIIIRGNNFDLPYGSSVYKVNSCIFLNEELAGASAANLSGTIIDGNWLNGGNFCVYAVNQTNTTITNNTFGSDQQYGLLYNPSGFAKPTWSGNVDVNGKTV